MTLEEVLAHEPEFQYKLLSRLQHDCEYYLGNGNRLSKNLWALCPVEHIKYMKGIHNALAEKPQWLSMEEIESYEAAMK